MNWKEKLFKNFRLYAVTDIRKYDARILRKVKQAYDGGADIVQFRAKEMPDAEIYALAEKMRKIADSCRKLFFVNDRLDIALACGADGIHLGQDDLPVAIAREVLKKAKASMWIGKSTHAIDQARQAVREKPDYIGAGPVFKTPTKPGYIPAGLAYIKQVAKNFSVPFVAIGGIDTTNIETVLKAGATRVAVVRAIFQAEDTYAATQKLRRKLDEFNA